MITLNKDIANNIVFTLTEKSVLVTPNYLFSMTNDSSGEQKVFSMDDVSSYPRRYNLFTLTENSVENLSAGTVSLKYGWGKYEVYESTGSTLNISDTTGRIIEEGKYFINGYPANFNGNNSNDIYL